MAEFLAFNDRLLKSKYVSMKVYGRSTTFVAGKERSLVIDKTVKIKGLDGPSIRVTDVKLLQDGSAPLRSIAELLNPSIGELHMVRCLQSSLPERQTNISKGNVTFSTVFQNISISELSGELNIRTGKNVLQQAGILLNEALVAHPDILAAFSAEASENAVHARLRGLRAENGVPWVNEVVRGMDQAIVLPLKGLL